MGGDIFSNANRVVSKDINHRNFHDRCETQRTSSIVAKDQKTGAKSSELSQCQSVQDRSHRMLANSEMNISPSKGIATNITGIRKGETQKRLEKISTAISLLGLALDFSVLGLLIVAKEHDGGASITGGILFSS